MQTLEELLVHEIKDLYSAETQIVEALPKLANAASNRELRQAFTEHLDQTRQQVNRLDQVMQRLGGTPTGETNIGIKGLIAEGEKIVRESIPPKIKDAALIGAAQRVEHYQIAAYGSAKELAKELGENEVQRLLNDTLQEEGRADQLLTKIATGGLAGAGVNQQAASGR